MKRSMKHLLLLLYFLPLFCFGDLSNHPFKHNLHHTVIPGKNERTMICMHGYSGNYQIAKMVKSVRMVDATIVSFNFPDHRMLEELDDFSKATFGTISELLPALFVIKHYVIDEGLQAVDLYGYSAGGGALVNVLATLNQTKFDKELATIGIGPEEKQKMMSAIQNGIVILDTPFKSAEEIIDARGSSPALEICGKNYRDSDLRPIDSLKRLKGLSLDVILHFQDPDEVIFNRDDALYIERLKQANKKGTTSVIISSDSGHRFPHLTLWSFYLNKISK